MIITKVLIDYLDSVLEVEAYRSIPKPVPEEFVVIEKTGSRTTDRISTSIIAIKSYSTSDYKAELLNEAVKTALDTMDVSGVSGVSLETDYPLNDTTEKRYRYQAVYEITHRS